MKYLVFNLFDIAVAGVLVVGIVQGRKRGMSGELIGLFQWLAILLVCAVIYRPLGEAAAQAGGFSLLWCSLVVYLASATLILLLFLGLNRRVRGKLVGSDYFGRAEYYLGMVSGVIRVSCMLLVVLAVLNARAFSPAEVKAMDSYQEDMYGSHFFPNLHTVQVAVFERSLVGPWIRQDLGFLLMKPTEADQLRASK